MQRSAVAAVVVVLLAAGSFAAAQGALDSSTLRTAVCHKTSSKAKPYQRIVVTTRAAHKT
jgi:hypothetical protein